MSKKTLDAESINRALEFLNWEIMLLERAPYVNGCEMTPEWAKQLEIYRTCKAAIERVVD